MAETTDVFVYGSLMVPEVLEAVVGRHFDARPAELHGFARCSVADPDRRAKGPVLLAEEGAVTWGLVLRGVDAASLARLDAFERRFHLIEVDVVTNGRAERVKMFELPDVSRLPLVRGWSVEAFRARHLAAYLLRLRGDPRVDRRPGLHQPRGNE